MLSVGPIMETLTLTVGSAFEIPGWKLRGEYPAGTTSHLVFTDAAGGTLGEFEGTVSAKEIHYLQAPDDVKDIPHGANFQLFVTYPSMQPQCLYYGTAIRKEPRYPLSTVVSPEDSAVQYKANFIGEYIGPMWKPMGNGWGSLGIHTHALISEVPSMGPNYSLFSSAAARWLWSMNMDSVTIVVRVLNVGAGKFNVIVCADYQMQTYLGIQFETGISNNKVHVITGDGPLDWDYQGAAVDNTTANGDVYTIKYNDLLDTISCYKGTSLTPLIEASGLDVPHGEGFRYTGLAWNTALLSPGVEPTAWEAKDGV
ncbi:minor tail protein [Mycobacterium phage DyoEdafos]|uniref:Minor tail protein n=1 Tax=Mycobacterium phage DyoEdafos TaxID=2599860 RepID=A0A5J6TI34_9CAUD|nr:minor tail protein [Mycobacterium phage DyoEdafos]QFG10256.1 minor tail protein [Mycobacterium phage DyoEdafos]